MNEVCDMETLNLREYRSCTLPADAFTEAEALELVERFDRVIQVDWPSPRTSGAWSLRPQGYVGSLVLGSGRVLRIAPKTPIANIFRMLELAWNVDLAPEEGRVEVETIEDLYRRLAVILARKVSRRLRIGLHRDYISRTERLPVVRGEMQLAETLATPWRVEPLCRYHEQTNATGDNQILSWTLDRILRRGLFTGSEGASRGEVISAWRGISSAAPPVSVEASDCTGRVYSRLNRDYREMHALCRFFLEGLGPTHHRGNRESFPFLLNMAQLFEEYVAAWLRRYGPDDIVFVPQERGVVDGTGSLTIYIDLVARRGPGGPVIAVLDTKYKAHRTPSNADVYQVQSYAALYGAPLAVLIYPHEIGRFDLRWGMAGTRVVAVGFPLEQMEQVGEGVLRVFGEEDLIAQ